MNQPRIASLIQRLQASEFDLLVLNPGPGLYHATGLQFHLMERPTLFVADRGGKTAMILPELEVNRVKAVLPELDCYTYGDNPSTWQASIRDAFMTIAPLAERIGVESTRLRFLELDFICKSLPAAEIRSADDLLSTLRAFKDPGEIELMRRAVQIAEQAYLQTLSFIKPGVTEQAIAAELTVNMLRLGSDTELPFPPIVASGPNSADPHAVPTGRAICSGDLVVIDWGASYKGYFSDLTRTVAVGNLDSELYTIYSAVQGANQAGREKGAPGILCGEVDKAGRAVIDAAGYGQYFIHRIGHGLGLEAHEEPYMFAESTQTLEVGHVYTIEPGIYLPGRGGVRIEDDMVVTTAGSESLSTLDRELITL